MRNLALVTAACLALAACSNPTSESTAPPSEAVSTSLDSLPATVEGRLVFDLDGGAEGDGKDVYATFDFNGDALSVKLPVPLARSLDLPDAGASVRVTISSEEIEDGDRTLVVTAAQKL